MVWTHQTICQSWTAEQPTKTLFKVWSQQQVTQSLLLPDQKTPPTLDSSPEKNRFLVICKKKIARACSEILQFYSIDRKAGLPSFSFCWKLLLWFQLGFEWKASAENYPISGSLISFNWIQLRRSPRRLFSSSTFQEKLFLQHGELLKKEPTTSHLLNRNSWLVWTSNIP